MGDKKQKRIDWHKVCTLMGATTIQAMPWGGVHIYNFDLCRKHDVLGIFLSDNGGEVNISGHNGRIDLPSIPVTHPRLDRYVNAATIADRLHKALQGLPIDYREELPNV